MFKSIIKSFIIFYSPKFPVLITYMLQRTEYQIKDYLSWFWKTKDFSKVQVRGDLERTTISRLILKTLNFGIILQFAIGVLLIYFDLVGKLAGGWGLGLGLIILYPVLWAHLICLPVILARALYIKPKETRLIKNSKNIFLKTKALKIVVAGSYGKTTMKELLRDVLGSQKKVAATPANMNVATSHAKFASSLKGDEDILILELGEGAPGDVDRFAKTIRPDIAVITGLSPAHLNKYKTIQAAGEDIFSLKQYVAQDKLYVNSESNYIKEFIDSKSLTYSEEGALGYQVSGVKNSISGISFNLTKGKTHLNLKSQLIGRHQIGPLSLVASLALELGLKPKDIEAAIKNTAAFEHRMQPYQLNGAWIIDDSYNGNIEGIRVGTELLHELKADRKIYITPGLVDQGSETKNIHLKLGELIASSGADKVILMNNSSTKYIRQGLEKGGFKGKLEIESNPLWYFTNLANFVAKGDVVLIQNDWTDNYN